MGRLSSVPREVLDAAWRAGLQGKRLLIPVRTAGGRKRSEIVRDLLIRAERRVVETGDVRREAIRQAWASDREEAARFGVAHSLVWRAGREAEAEILRWWREGERERQQRIRAMDDAAVAMAEYQRARREIRGDGPMPRSIRIEILAMASRSVAAAWWGREARARGLDLVLAEEVAYLSVLAVDGRVGMGAVGRVVASRLGVSPEESDELMRRVDSGVARAARELALHEGERRAS